MRHFALVATFTLLSIPAVYAAEPSVNAADGDKPAKPRDQRTVEKGNRFADFAANETLATTGEQVVPITSQKQRIHD